MLSVAETPWFENNDERDPQIARLAQMVAISIYVAWCAHCVRTERRVVAELRQCTRDAKKCLCSRAAVGCGSEIDCEQL